jgi:hypothetical protein
VVGEDGYFQRISKSFVEALGYDEETLFSRPASEFIVKEVKRKRDGCFAYYFENYYCCKNSRVIKIIWKKIPDACQGAVLAIGWELDQNE